MNVDGFQQGFSNSVLYIYCSKCREVPDQVRNEGHRVTFSREVPDQVRNEVIIHHNTAIISPAQLLQVYLCQTISYSFFAMSDLSVS